MERFDFAFTPSRGPARGECAREGRQAMAITNAGGYVALSGRRVELRAAVDRALAGTLTRIRVFNGTSLASARELAARGPAPLVLNFASAKNPGGGFLDGARAQEESLARASSLHATLLTSGMYAHHRAQGDALYTNWMILSPDVPVFRDEATEATLEEPYLCAFAS